VAVGYASLNPDA